MTGHISAPEAAVLARISRERLLRLVQQGKIEGEKIGGSWMISAPSLDRFLQQQAAGESAPAAASR